jgi:predicted O-methyltransferase YrrM
MNNIASLDAAHPLQPYWDLTLASVQADALRVALETRLFSHLRVPLSAPALAARLQLHPANTGYLLELLWSMGLLQRQGEAGTGYHYRAAAVASRYLADESSDYCGDAWVFRLRALRHFGGQLDEQLRSGRPGPSAPNLNGSVANWAAAARLQIAQEQRAVTAAAALAVMQRVPEFPQARRLLDLGGGPGLVAIALAEANPGLSGEVFDYPATAAVAQQNIDRAGLDGRLSVRGGDLLSDAIGEGYDLIWCSSVLHFVADVGATLSMIHAALRPGGVLVCAHAEIPPTAAAALQVMPYYLSMRMLGRHVSVAGGLCAALQKTGFVSIDCFEQVAFAMAPVAVQVARRALS